MRTADHGCRLSVTIHVPDASVRTASLSTASVRTFSPSNGKDGLPGPRAVAALIEYFRNAHRVGPGRHRHGKSFMHA